jgi:rRNA-processing protein FCF1
MKTIAVSEKTHKQLMSLKLDSNAKNADELLEKLMIEHRKIKLIEAANQFRKRIEKNKLGIKDIKKESRKIRDELYAEWFSKSSS